MRKYKQVKRKEVVFSLDEWNEVERRAEKISMTTSQYIRSMAVNGEVNYFEFANVTPLMNAFRIIGNNINQVAKKANEINSIYADDIEIIRKENLELCRMLSQFLSEQQSTAA